MFFDFTCQYISREKLDFYLDINELTCALMAHMWYLHFVCCSHERRPIVEMIKHMAISYICVEIVPLEHSSTFLDYVNNNFRFLSHPPHPPTPPPLPDLASYGPDLTFHFIPILAIGPDGRNLVCSAPPNSLCLATGVSVLDFRSSLQWVSLILGFISVMPDAYFGLFNL